MTNEGTNKNESKLKTYRSLRLGDIRLVLLFV